MDPEVELLATNLLKVFAKHSDNNFRNWCVDMQGDLTAIHIEGVFNFTQLAKELKEME